MRSHLAIRLLLLTVVPAAAATVTAQDPVGLDRRYWRPEVLEVKLVDGTGAVLNPDGSLDSRHGVDLSDVAPLFRRAVRVERLVGADLADLDRLHRQAVAATPAGLERPGHLGLWFGLHCESEAAARGLMKELRRQALVTHVNVQPIPYVASTPVPLPTATDDIPPTTPDFTAQQLYFGPAPNGHGFAQARRIHGARGTEVRLFHIEADWLVDHEDLPTVSLQNFLGAPTPGTGELADHGIGVLGILVGGRNAYGVTGAVDGADVRLVSWLNRVSIASTIVDATLASSPGDIGTLISGYNLFQTKPADWVPAEYFQINFDAIRTATANGLILVTAAVNGTNDLDDPRFYGRFDLSVRDSGAIMVGGTEGATNVQADYSNHGSRVDCAGWGRNTVTLGFGGLFKVPGDRRQSYSYRYAGTSSGSAIVSAVVASYVGAVTKQTGRKPTVSEVRDLLRTVGSPVTGHIGMRNDVPSLLAAAGVPSGLDVDRHEVELGGSLRFTMAGAAGGTAILAVAPVDADVGIGLNRKWHLDPAGTITVGGFALAGGSATFRLDVPNNPQLQGLDLFWQAVILDGSSVRISTSAATWVR